MFTYTQTGTARATLTKGKLDTAKIPPYCTPPSPKKWGGSCEGGGS